MDFWITAGIAFGGDDHAERGFGPDGQLDLIKPPVDAGIHDLQQIAFKAHQQGLTFRVSETDVVFQNFRAVFGHHQAGIKDTGERMPLPGHFGEDRADGDVGHLFELRIGHNRGRAVGAHTPGIGAGVAVENGLVVLRGRQRGTLSRWQKELRDTGDIESRGSGNYASDEAKEIARLKRELRDAQDALNVLKKAINILGK